MAEWPIFVLSLPSAKTRRADIAEQFDRLGLDFEFLEAVDGRQGLPADLEPMVDRPGTVALTGYGMSDGEYACALSHQQAYARIIDQNLPGAIILEDDAILTWLFRDFYQARQYQAGDLIQLYHYNGTVHKRRPASAGPLALMRLATNSWMAVGYSISRRGAERMRQHSLPLRARADWPCDTFRILDHYVTWPRAVLHPVPIASQSTIDKSGVIPEGFDFSRDYAKGWRRLLSPGSWRRLLRRPFLRQLDPGRPPTPDEGAQLVCDRYREVL